MDSRLRNMTSGSPMGLLIRFSLPLMAGNIFQQLYTVVDTAIVGKFLGVDAMAALGCSDWLSWMMLGTIQGFTQGFAILMAQCFGAGQHDRLRKVVGNSVVLSVLSAAFLLVLGQYFLQPILGLLQTPADIMPVALLYMRIIFLGTPVIMAYNLLSCILRSLGDSNTPLYAMIVASIVNIVLDLVFVLVFHWGIAGAAIATLIAQVVSGVYCLIRICKIDLLRLKKEHFKLDWHLGGKLIALGSPMAFQNAVIAVGGMIVQMVANLRGVIFIAGFTATNKLYGLLEIAATSYGYAVVTYVGQNLGGGSLHRIRKGVRSANLLAFITSLLIAAFMILLGKPIVGLFLSGTPAEMAQATDIAYRYLFIMSAALPILYYLHVSRSAIQGLGNTVFPMISGIAEFIMRTATALFLPVFIGEYGIFLAEVMAWAGADLVLVVSYVLTIRKVSRQMQQVI